MGKSDPPVKAHLYASNTLDISVCLHYLPLELEMAIQFAIAGNVKAKTK